MPMPKPKLKIKPASFYDGCPDDLGIEDFDSKVKSSSFYVTDKEGKGMLVEMRRSPDGEWRFLPHFRHKKIGWLGTGLVGLKQATKEAEKFVLTELENITMSKISLEAQLIESIGKLSSQVAFRLKKTIDTRVQTILAGRIATLMGGHALSQAEKNFVAVLLAEEEVRKSKASRALAENNHLKYIKKLIGQSKQTDPSTFVRADKCKAVAEQILHLRQEVANASSTDPKDG